MRRVIIVSIIIIAALLAGVYVYHYVGENKTSESTTLPLVGIMSDENLLKVIPIEIDPQRKEVSYGDALLSIKPGALLGLYTSSGKLFAYVDPTIDEHYKVSGDVYILEKYHLPNACLPGEIFPYAGGLGYICGTKIYLFDGKEHVLLYDLSKDTDILRVNVTVSGDMSSAHVSVPDHITIDHINYADPVSDGSVRLYYNISYDRPDGVYVEVGFIVLPKKPGEPLHVEKYSKVITVDDARYVYFVYYSDDDHTWHELRYDADYFNVADVKEQVRRMMEVESKIQADYYYEISTAGKMVMAVFSIKSHQCDVFNRDKDDVVADLSIYRQSPFLSGFVTMLSSGKEGPVYRTFHIKGYTVTWYPGFIQKGCYLIEDPEHKNLVKVEKDGTSFQIRLMRNILYIAPRQ
jgi:hypothetical protein